MSFRHTRFGRCLMTAVSTFAVALGPILVAGPGAAWAAESPANSERAADVSGKPSQKGAAAKKPHSHKAGKASKTPAKEGKRAKAARASSKQPASKPVKAKGAAELKKQQKAVSGNAALPAKKKAPEASPPQVEHAGAKPEMTALSKPAVVVTVDPPKPEHAEHAHAKAKAAPKAEPAPAKGDTKVHRAAKAEKSEKGKAKAPKAKTAAKEKAASAKPSKGKRGATASRESSSKRKTSKSSGKSAKKSGNDKEAPKPPCYGPVITVDRSGLEGESLPLVYCDGRPVLASRDKLSVLARPWGAARPETLAPSTGKTGQAGSKVKADALELAPGIRRLDSGLLLRLNAIAQKFPSRHISVVSGYRPQSKGSHHQTGRALDVRVMGIANEELVNFCKTLKDTGCGYYPNSSFVHVDVRQAGAGSVTWIDASGPGEAPRYVTQWPPPKEEEIPAVGAAPKGEADAGVNENLLLEKESGAREQDKAVSDAIKPEGAKEAPLGETAKP